MKYYKRGFLNQNEGMAAFCANVEYEPCADRDYAGAIDGGFSLTDCSRQVSLDFYIYSEADYLNAMHKLDTLQGELASFRGAINEAWAMWKDVEAKRLAREAEGE